MIRRLSSVELDAEGQRLLAELQQRSGKSAGDLVREALEAYSGAGLDSGVEAREDESLYEQFKRAGLIGCYQGDAPSDLSTNKAHFEGFGRD
jgi:hypothetical protein